MSLIVRKINRAKWEQSDYHNSNDVSADAITLCMKTDGNTLSVWHITSENDIDKAVLAMATGCERIDKMDFVIIDVGLINKNNLTLNSTPGITPVDSMVESHRNIADLTYSKLGFVKDIIVDKLKNNQTKHYTKSDLKKLILNAIEVGLIQQTALKASLLDKILNR